MAQKQKAVSKKDETTEEIEDLPETEKRDLTETDKLLDKIDEILDKETVAEQMRKQEFKEKIHSIGFTTTKRDNDGLYVVEETLVASCTLRCENCTCGR